MQRWMSGAVPRPTALPSMVAVTVRIRYDFQ